MASIRRTGIALLAATALGLSVLASAEQAQACDGDKAEHKQPTAEREKQDAAKSGQKVDKTDSKQQPDKSDPNQTNKS